MCSNGSQIYLLTKVGEISLHNGLAGRRERERDWEREEKDYYIIKRRENSAFKLLKKAHSSECLDDTRSS